MTNIISLNKKQILEYQQNKPPYLMIDEALEIIPGKSAKGFKQLEDDEWFLKSIGKMIQICLECCKLKH